MTHNVGLSPSRGAAQNREFWQNLVFRSGWRWDCSATFYVGRFVIMLLAYFFIARWSGCIANEIIIVTDGHDSGGTRGTCCHDGAFLCRPVHSFWFECSSSYFSIVALVFLVLTVHDDGHRLPGRSGDVAV